MPPKGKSNQSGYAGYSLIEVVVAQAVISIALLVNIKLLSAGLMAPIMAQYKANAIADRAYAVFNRAFASAGFVGLMPPTAYATVESADDTFNQYYNLRYPIEQRAGKTWQPSGSNYRLNSLAESDALTLRYVIPTSISRVTFIAPNSLLTSARVSDGAPVAIFSKTTAFTARVSDSSASLIQLFPPVNADINQAHAIGKISLMRLYLRKTGNATHALWRAQPSAANPLKMVNVQLVENICALSLHWQNSSLVWSDTIDQTQPPLRVRIAIAVCLADPRAHKTSTITLNNTPFTIEPRLQAYGYEWQFPLTRYGTTSH